MGLLFETLETETNLEFVCFPFLLKSRFSGIIVLEKYEGMIHLTVYFIFGVCETNQKFLNEKTCTKGTC